MPALAPVERPPGGGLVGEVVPVAEGLDEESAFTGTEDGAVEDGGYPLLPGNGGQDSEDVQVVGMGIAM